MSGIEPQTSGVGNDRFATWATTTATLVNSFTGLDSITLAIQSLTTQK